MERLRFGIIGRGARGICNARAVAARPDIELVGLCDVRPERLEECARAGINAPGFADYRDLLAEGLDAVCINTDNNVHAEITLAAAKDQRRGALGSGLPRHTRGRATRESDPSLRSG